MKSPPLQKQHTLGIHLQQIDAPLEAECIEKFVAPYQKLPATPGRYTASVTAR